MCHARHMSAAVVRTVNVVKASVIAMMKDMNATAMRKARRVR